MVHALEITHDLLKEGGLLLDIHPSGEPPRIEARVGEKVSVAGYLEETDGFVEYFNADDALADVTGRGLFALEREGLFTFMLHASTIVALADFLEAEWSDSVLHEETIELATELMGEPGEGREIVLRESVRIARFRASGR
ncbi:MAG: hypothetical protein KAS36_00695 [Anaerolineales bacterium]|nr:hypothetical protein [Anaerolineales bacterium]